MTALCYTPSRSEVSNPATGARTTLPPTLEAILVRLVEGEGAIVPVHALLAAAPGSKSPEAARVTLRANIIRLRKVLAAIDLTDAIQTRHGVGWRLRLPAMIEEPTTPSAAEADPAIPPGIAAWVRSHLPVVQALMRVIP